MRLLIDICKTLLSDMMGTWSDCDLRSDLISSYSLFVLHWRELLRRLLMGRDNGVHIA
jgi:hypothetical protein